MLRITLDSQHLLECDENQSVQVIPLGENQVQIRKASQLEVGDLLVTKIGRFRILKKQELGENDDSVRENSDTIEPTVSS